MTLFCFKHNYFYHDAKCEKCIAGEPPYLYTRDEVADPDEWERFVKYGWTKNG